MRKLFTILIVTFFTANIVSAQQIILSNDTTLCGSFNDTLYALSSSASGVVADDTHGPVVDIGFTFNFYGNPYTQLVISGNGYLTFDLTQANQGSPWNINTAIPNPGSMPENAILAPWQDIHSGLGGSITYSTAGIAPNRVFVVTWCAIPMYSCNNLLHTSQVVLHEGTDKIEMFLQDKPLCSTFNSGAAIQGLVDIASANVDIVIDPATGSDRNYPLQWTAINEGWQFIPNGGSTYLIDTIPYVPIVAGETTWEDINGNVLGVGATLYLDTNITTTIFASVSGVCNFGNFIDSVIITIPACFDLGLSSVSASCFGDDAEITCQPDTLLPTWQCELCRVVD